MNVFLIVYNHNLSITTGAVAQMVERSLCMWEVPGSIPGSSNDIFNREEWKIIPTFIILCYCIKKISQDFQTKASEDIYIIRKLSTISIVVSHCHVGHICVPTRQLNFGRQWDEMGQNTTPNVGLEPTTPRLRVSCSTDWASRADENGGHKMFQIFSYFHQASIFFLSSIITLHNDNVDNHLLVQRELPMHSSN